eukprot:2728-Heterococcus_DN1.PRE.3
MCSWHAASGKGSRIGATVAMYTQSLMSLHNAQQCIHVSSHLSRTTCRQYSRVLSAAECVPDSNCSTHQETDTTTTTFTAAAAVAELLCYWCHYLHYTCVDTYMEPLYLLLYTCTHRCLAVLRSAAKLTLAGAVDNTAVLRSHFTAHDQSALLAKHFAQ